MKERQLTQEEANACQLEVEAIHPFWKIKLIDLFKCLGVIYKGIFARKQSSNKIEGNLDKENKRDEDQNYKKIFASLGFGIHFYFYMLGVLALFFLGAAVLSSWMFYSYSQGSRTAGDHFLFGATLGNVGFNQPQCQALKLEWNKLNLTCDSGVLNQIELFGYPSENFNTFSRCDISVSNRIQEEDMKSLFDFSACINQPYCSINLNKTYVSLKMPVENNRIFLLKYSCGQSDLKEAKKISNIWVTFIINAIITTAFVVVIFLMLRYEHKAFNRWDVSVTTAADYTVSCYIPRNVYQDFCKKLQKEEIAIESFTKFLKENIQEELEKVFPCSKKCIISQLNYAFSNEELILGLINRGAASIAGNSKEKKLKEKEIESLVSAKAQQMVIPTEAFITFEEENWYNNCLDLKELTINKEISLSFKEVPEYSKLYNNLIIIIYYCIIFN